MTILPLAVVVAAAVLRAVPIASSSAIPIVGPPLEDAQGSGGGDRGGPRDRARLRRGRDLEVNAPSDDGASEERHYSASGYDDTAYGETNNVEDSVEVGGRSNNAGDVAHTGTRQQSTHDEDDETTASIYFKQAVSVPERCSCSPVAYNFTLDLSRDCTDDDLRSNPGIRVTFCTTDGITADVNAAKNSIIEVTSIQFVEFDASGELMVINTDDAYSNNVSLSDGDSFGFASISDNLDPNLSIDDQLDMLPGGVQLTIVGRAIDPMTGTETMVSNRNTWSYTNECGALTMEEGDGMGWVTLANLEQTSGDFCFTAPATTATKATTITTTTTDAPAATTTTEVTTSTATDAPTTTTDTTTTTTTVPSAADIVIVSCSFCPGGLSDPSLVLPTEDEATCAEMAGFAAGLAAGDDDASCTAIRLSETFCCPDNEDGGIMVPAEDDVTGAAVGAAATIPATADAATEATTTMTAVKITEAPITVTATKVVSEAAGTEVDAGAAAEATEATPPPPSPSQEGSSEGAKQAKAHKTPKDPMAKAYKAGKSSHSKSGKSGDDNVDMDAKAEKTKGGNKSGKDGKNGKSEKGGKGGDGSLSMGQQEGSKSGKHSKGGKFAKAALKKVTRHRLFVERHHGMLAVTGDGAGDMSM